MSKSNLFLPFDRQVSRRAVLAAMVVAVAPGAAITRSATVFGGSPGSDDTVEDVCYRETQRTKCSDGRRLEYRCEICCAGGVCETVQCLWFDIGPC